MSDEQICENCGKPIGQHSWPGEFCVYGPEPKTSQWKPKEMKMSESETEFDRALSIYKRDWPNTHVDVHSAMVGWNLRSTSGWLPEKEREAIREETRAEVMKDILDIQKMIDEKLIRRPAKKRALTRVEKCERLEARFRASTWMSERLSESTMNELLEMFGEPTEVEE